MHRSEFSCALIAVLILLLASGCTRFDPYDELAETPADASERYDGESPRPPRISPPVVPEEETPLSLADCIHIALQNSPQARISWQRTRSAAMAVGRNRGRLFPQLDFSSNAQRIKYQVLTEVEDEYQRTTYNAQFGVRQLLFDAGATGSEISAAEAALRSADFQHNSTLLDIALNTEQAYYETIAGKALVEVARDALNQRQRHVDLAERRLEAGRGRRVDTLRAQAEKANARLGVVETRNQLRQARGRLAASMGLKASTKLQVRDIPYEIKDRVMDDVDKLMAEAAERRPRLKAAVEEVNRLRHRMESEEARKWPNLTASGSYGWEDTHLLPTDKEEWDMVLNLQWPLFTGFQRSYSIYEVREAMKRAINTYERLLRDVELQVWNAYSGVLRAREAITAAEAYVKSASKTVDVAERGYEEGRATIVELVDAQTELTRARGRRVQAYLDWHRAIARVERAVGRQMAEAK